MTYAFGGPEEYHGKDMWRAHERLVREKGLNDHHFDVIVKHLVAALKAFNVPEVRDLSLLLWGSLLIIFTPPICTVALPLPLAHVQRAELLGESVRAAGRGQ